MKTDNELIAEFMGLPLTKEQVKFTGGTQTVPFQKWQYDTSWDWLMPVCQKIFQDGYPEDGFKCVMVIKKSLDSADLYGAYRGVVNFIKWYNDQNK